MHPHNKHLDFNTATATLDGLRAGGKTIVQCHGTFDLLHPGHFVHFEEAAELGDILVVTITAEKDVNKGPGRPYFNDDLRVRSIAALACVDYVIVVPFPAAVEAIECVKPTFYCKGREYANPEVDVTGNIHNDVAAVEKHGGEMAYVGSVVFSSTRLLNQHFEPYAPEVKACCQSLAAEYPAESVVEMVESFSDLKVLVLGDIIFDRYTSVKVQGLTSKNKILSGRFLTDEMQAGGALAVYRHVREFAPNTKIMGLVGDEDWVEDELAAYVKPEGDHILRVPGFTSIIKQRFIEPQVEGKELVKLFSVNNIDADHPGPELQKQIFDHAQAEIEAADVVLVMDFGHGVMEGILREHVQKHAKFLALNCQTNSNNHGFNVINQQYHRADSFSLDQTEIQLAMGSRHLDYVESLANLREHLSSDYAWLTRGEVETIGLCSDGSDAGIPPIERNAIDTIGAGDAFCAVASLAAAKGVPIQLSTFMGQLAGAQAVRIVGNRDCITKGAFLKGVTAMLSF